MNIEDNTDIAALLRSESRRMWQQARELAHTVDMLRDTSVPRGAATAQVRRCEAIAKDLGEMSDNVEGSASRSRRAPVMLLAVVTIAAAAAGAMWWRGRRG